MVPVTCTFYSAGTIVLYLSQREYVNVDGNIDQIRGLAHLPDCKDKYREKTVFASLVCIFRHGRKEDETCGLKFSKELVTDQVQVSSIAPI